MSSYVHHLTDCVGMSWSAAFSVSSNIVVEQTETDYDDDGNALEVRQRLRFHDATGTGALGTPSTGIAARVYDRGMYYDLADRLIASVNVGTNGGSAWSRPGSVPSRSDTVLVNETSYDLLGRTTQTVEAYDGGAVTADTNRTTQFAYDGANHLVLYTAIVDNSGSPVQVQQTAFIYGVTPSIGSSISSNDLLAATQFPNKTTGAPSSSEQEIYTYNALGNRTGFIDRNQSQHTYEFDVIGRPTINTVKLASGSDVDGSVLQLSTAHDAQGNAYLLTSIDGGSTIVNQVQRVFNGLGQLIAEYQEHAGAVNTSTTRSVQYSYTEMASGVNHSRPTSVVYPSGFTVSMTYTTTLDDAIGRLHRLTDGSARLEEYSYLGLGTLVVRGHQEVGVDLTYIKLSGESNGDAGDKYIGLDRFGRVVDQRWLNSSNAALDRFQYGYDRNSNRLYRDNLVNTAFGELYHANGSSNGYDHLNQLTDFARGTLNSTHDSIGSPTREQEWTLDPQGNFPTVVTNSATQTRTHNRQNQLVQVTNGSSVALTFDANGNMTVDELGNELTYDAWNRLVKVESGSTVLAEYAYDALTRRTLGYGLDLYYSQNWQVLEEFVTGQDAAVARYVWSIAYIDALVLRERFNSSAYDRLYVLQDANWNVTSLASLSAAIQERYIFDPYGLRTVLDASWSPLSGSAFDWVYAHQGGKLDVDAGLYSFRYRDLRPTLMRWGSMDPIRSGWNLYEYANDNPPNGLDPSGLIRIVGVIPPPQKLYIYQIEGTDRPIAPWRVGDCYTQANGRYNWVQCPATPADDPEGPSYLHGVQGLVSGYRLLLAACERCATGAGGCTKEKCRSDAADLVFRLVNAWQNNYGRGCHSAVGDPVGGHLCWDWSRIFLQAVQGLRSPCFQYQEWAASPRDPRSNYVHYYLWVGVGGGMTPECSVMFDDGFFNPRGGGTASPLHPFPRHPDWYPNDPRNVPPSQRRCPFIPLPY